MQKLCATICDGSSNPLSGVLVTVNLAGTGTLASLYADRHGNATKANPFTNDDNGSWEAYLPSGRYDVVYSKTGSTFDTADTSDLLVFDPLEMDAYYAVFGFDAMSAFLSGSSLIVGGEHLGKLGTVVLSAPGTSRRNGWLDVAGNGAAAASIFQADTAGLQINPFTITADPLILDCNIDKLTTQIATLRIGLAGASLSAGDPANGFYVRQVDSANAFLVVRSGSADSGVVDLGVSLSTTPRRIRIVAMTSSIRAYVDGVAKTPVTASIPTGQMFAFSAMSSVITSGVGLGIDYARVWAKR